MEAGGGAAGGPPRLSERVLGPGCLKDEDNDAADNYNNSNNN